MNDILETYMIRKTLVICGNEDDACDKAAQLNDEDHSVVMITYEDVTDERYLVRQKLRLFENNCARVMICSYRVWMDIEGDLEDMAMDHNLLVMYNTVHQQERAIMDWIVYCKEHGFLRQPYHVVYE